MPELLWSPLLRLLLLLRLQLELPRPGVAPRSKDRFRKVEVVE
jgi:hypothetical protein